MAMNNRRMTPMAEPGILDFAPGAAAAYSLRNLSLSYSGPVVTVRRSTDSAEADFTASEVSDGTLAGWAGADGFVKQWWDQSGNARHATASGTAQPQIVDSGVLVTEGGKAAVRFDGVNDTLSVSAAFIGTADVSFASVQKLDVLTPAQTVFYAGDTVANQDYITANYDPTDAAYRLQCRVGISGFALALSADTDARHAVLFATRVGTTSTMYANAATDSAVTDAENGVSVSGALFLMSFRNVIWVAGTMQEFLIYPADQTALRTRIEGNLAWYY